MAYTVSDLLGTSADDLKATLVFVTDVKLLQQALLAAVDRGYVTKAIYLERRIKQLQREINK